MGVAAKSCTLKKGLPLHLQQNGCLRSVHHQQSWRSDLLPGQPAGAVRGPAAVQVPPELRAGGRGQGRHDEVREEGGVKGKHKLSV